MRVSKWYAIQPPKPPQTTIDKTYQDAAHHIKIQLDKALGYAIIDTSTTTKGLTMNKQQQHIIATLIQPHINSGNKDQAKRMIDTLIRSARSSKAKQALQAFKANLG